MGEFGLARVLQDILVMEGRACERPGDRAGTVSAPGRETVVKMAAILNWRRALLHSLGWCAPVEGGFSLALCRTSWNRAPWSPGPSPLQSEAVQSTEREHEAELARRLIAGDSQAFDHFVDYFRAKIYHYSWLMCGRREDAEEVAQETLLKVFESADQLREPDKVKSWVFRIAKNACLMKRRKSIFALQGTFAGRIDAR